MAETYAGDDLFAAQQQDALRPVRAFVGALQQVLGSDQSYSGTDGGAYNPPRQFVYVGPNGFSIEGQPLAQGTRDGGLAVSPLGIALAVGVAWLVLRRKRG